MNDRASSPPRILLVEPNRDALSVMAKRLNQAGYRVIGCDSGSAAVAELYRLPPDLVIAELRMSGMSGIELARLVRDDSVLKDLPVLLITGRTDAGGAVEGFAAGADDVVAKPFDFEVLLARVARMLARARSLKQLRSDNATLDARVIERSIELGEIRDELRRIRSAA